MPRLRYDNILLSDTGLRLIDVGISALRSQVGEWLLLSSYVWSRNSGWRLSCSMVMKTAVPENLLGKRGCAPFVNTTVKSAKARKVCF